MPLLPVLPIALLDNDVGYGAFVNTLYSDCIAVWVRTRLVETLDAAYAAEEMLCLLRVELQGASYSLECERGAWSMH